MARPLRIVHPGAWYHITARGVGGRPIFRDQRDRLHFLELLAELTERFRLRMHAYVLMDNHYHLFFELTQPNLSHAIQWLNLSYNAWFNHRHDRPGNLFRGRFKSILVDPVAWTLPLSAYIHLNPVRLARFHVRKANRQKARSRTAKNFGADLARKRLSALRSYRWSSYQAYVGSRACPSWLDVDAILEQAGGPAARRPSNYRSYVEKQIREGLSQKPWDQLHDQILLGSGSFLTRMRDHAAKQLSPGARRLRWAYKPISLREVIRAVEKVRGLSWNELKDLHADSSRDSVLFLARRATNLTVGELARATGLNHHATVSMACKRYAALLAKNRRERALAQSTAELLDITL